MKESVISDPYLDLLVLLDAATRDVLKVRKTELEQSGLTYIQVRLLYLLLEMGEGVKITDISAMLSRKPHSISELITRMESSGLIKKTRVPPGRTTLVTITKKGRDLYAGVSRKSLEILFTTLDEDERRQFDGYLKRIRAKARELIGLDYVPPFLA